MNKDNVKGQIEFLLRNKPYTRDSDMDLMIELRRFYNIGVEKDAHNMDSLHIPIRVFRTLPQLDLVSRIRRAFNQSGLYISNNKEIRIQRRQNTEKYLAFLGYN